MWFAAPFSAVLTPLCHRRIQENKGLYVCLWVASDHVLYACTIEKGAFLLNTRLMSMEKSLLFQTDRLIHIWILNIIKMLVHCFFLWWPPLWFMPWPHQNCSYVLCFLGGACLSLEFGLLSCLTLMGSKSYDFEGYLSFPGCYVGVIFIATFFFPAMS